MKLHKINDTNVSVNEFVYWEPKHDPVNNDKFVTYFDFEFLQIWFDGKTLVIFKPDQILLKYSNYQHIKCIENYTFYKEMEKSDQIENGKRSKRWSYYDVNQKRAIKMRVKRFKKRLYKYQNRGYEICTECNGQSSECVKKGRKM